MKKLIELILFGLVWFIVSMLVLGIYFTIFTLYQFFMVGMGV